MAKNPRDSHRSVALHRWSGSRWDTSSFLLVLNETVLVLNETVLVLSETVLVIEGIKDPKEAPTSVQNRANGLHTASTCRRRSILTHR